MKTKMKQGLNSGTAPLSYPRFILPLLLAGSMGLMAALPSSGTLITVLNPSFESPDAPTVLSSNPIDNWSKSGQFWTGLYDPSDPAFVPDGDQFAFTGQAGTISQITAGTLTADATYTLQVDVGHGKADGQINLQTYAGYLIGLYAADGTLLTQDNNTEADPGAGNWRTITLNYTAPSSGDPLLGQAIEIRLQNPQLIKDPQPNDKFPASLFDNVRLSEGVVPEPGTLALLLAGLLTITGVRRRMQHGPSYKNQK